jgi:ribosome maturation factor RimP
LSVKDQIRPAVAEPLAALGLHVEDVAVTPAGKRRLVRIWIDRVLPESADAITTVTEPLTLDEVADATRAVSESLDEADVMGEQPYTLEVTSPGLDRPLTAPRHFRRNVTRLVTLTPVEGPAVTGRIVSAGPDGLTLEVPAAKKTPARTVELTYAAVSRAVVEVEFSRPSAGATEDGATDDDDRDLHDQDLQDGDLHDEDLHDEDLHDGDDDTEES